MSARKAYSRYRQATVETASPGKLVLMLYDGALRFLGDALRHLEGGQPKDAHFAIVRAEDIVCELMSSLDMDQGGQIAKNLLALYEFVYLQLVEANLHKEPDKIRECMSLLSDLREAWSQAVDIHAQQQFRAKQTTLPEDKRTPTLGDTAPAASQAARIKLATPAEGAGKPKSPPEGPPPGGFSIVS